MRRIASAYVGMCVVLLVALGCSESVPVESGCEEAQIPYDPSASNGEILVSGTIPRPDGVAGPPAHVFLDLLESIDADALPERLAWQYKRVDAWPIQYTLRGSPSVFHGFPSEISVHAKVTTRADLLPTVGDMRNEFRHLVSTAEPTFDFVISVSPLEHCDDPDSGGFCTTCTP